MSLSTLKYRLSGSNKSGSLKWMNVHKRPKGT